MPYFTIRYPDYEASLDVIETCVQAGADLMELGMPFADPLADRVFASLAAAHRTGGSRVGVWVSSPARRASA